jgi:hypothetical protein
VLVVGAGGLELKLLGGPVVVDKLTTRDAVDEKLVDDIEELPSLDGLPWKELLRAGGVNGGGVDGILETVEDTLGLAAEVDGAWVKVPQTSSSQEAEFPVFVAERVVLGAKPAALVFPTNASKSAATGAAAMDPFPLAAVAERSSIRCESRKNWLCSRSTLSPRVLMTDINCLNCATFNTKRRQIRIIKREFVEGQTYGVP